MTAYAQQQDGPSPSLAQPPFRHLRRGGLNSNGRCWLNGKNRTHFNLLAFDVALGTDRTRRL